MLRRIGLPVMLAYPLATVLIGAILSDQRGRIRLLGEMRENEERLRLALHATNQGLFDLNCQTGETLVNPEYARMLGYDPGSFPEAMRNGCSGSIPRTGRRRWGPTKATSPGFCRSTGRNTGCGPSPGIGGGFFPWER